MISKIILYVLKPAPSTGIGKQEVYPSTRSLCFVLERFHTCLDQPCFSVVSHTYSTYFALYNSDFRLKSKTIKHCFYCNVESPSSLNRRHFLKKMSAGGKERASRVLGLLPCLPAYSRWVSSDGGGQAAPPNTPVAHRARSLHYICCEGGGSCWRRLFKLVVSDL